MSLYRKIFDAKEKHLLSVVMLELTYRCNLDCFFCYNDVGLKGRALSREQYFALLEDLDKLQVFEVALTGGEPLVHPEFFAIGSRARELGFVVRVKSNGHLLSAKMVERLKREVDPFVVDVSLHGVDAETHDRQTRVEGSFDRLLENLGTASEAGLRVKLNTTLTRWNEHQVEEIFDLADRLGLRLNISTTVTPRDDGDMTPLDIAPSQEGIARLVRTGLRRSASRAAGERPDPIHQEGAGGSEKMCGTGASTLVVDPYGTVFPCMQWRRSLGSLHDQSLAEIWETSPMLAEVRGLSERAKRMFDELEPSDRPVSHCLGLSEQQFGDPLAIEPASRVRARVLAEAERAESLLPIIG